MYRDVLGAVLGPEHGECTQGAVVNGPGSAVQGWHRDGPHLLPDRQPRSTSNELCVALEVSRRYCGTN